MDAREGMQIDEHTDQGIVIDKRVIIAQPGSFAAQVAGLTVDPLGARSLFANFLAVWILPIQAMANPCAFAGGIVTTQAPRVQFLREIGHSWNGTRAAPCSV